MLPDFSTLFNYWSNRRRAWRHFRAALTTPPLQRPNLTILARSPEQLPLFVAECPVARKYLDLLAPLDWAHFPERDPNRPWPGTTPVPRAPFVAAFLVKLNQSLPYMSDLRTFLVEHPALVWLLGFELAPDPAAPFGFDVEASVPSTRLFLSVLRSLDNAVLQFLPDNTVAVIRQELPAEVEFGRTVAIDTKHIIAWVKENNPKAFIKNGRYDKHIQPAGDQDCKLGVKKRRNQKSGAKNQPLPATIPTPTRQAQPARHFSVAELYWGYGSGLVATKVPDWGEFILAEMTQTFNRPDVSYFFPLMEQTQRRLGFCAPFAALDAAFDSHYVYDFFDQAGGFAAVPFSRRGGSQPRLFSADGLPLCQAGLPMPLKNTFMNRRGLYPYRQARYGCPLLLPEPTGQSCPVEHKRWPKGGCLSTFAASPGARIRHQLDRNSDQYKQVYKQRTATERINALAVALGIERPKVRNQGAITNLNSLIYVLLNLRAIHRIRCKKQQLNSDASGAAES